jgi:hypothetical protein
MHLHAIAIHVFATGQTCHARRTRHARETPGNRKTSVDVWAVLERLGVDPAEHFAKLLLASSHADDKRKDEQVTPARRRLLTIGNLWRLAWD